MDVISIQPRNNCVLYKELESMPYALEHICNKGSHLVISLEFGKEKAIEPFSVSRINRTNTNEANRSTFLHPVVRYYENGTLLNEHHIIEDLFGVWKEAEHVEPLLNYLEEQFKQLVA